MRVFDVIKKVQPTSDDMREYFECSLGMQVEFEEVRREFVVKVVDIRFGWTSFYEVVGTVEKFSSVKAKPSYLTRRFDGYLQTPMHTINLFINSFILMK